ncbi:MAG: RNB domain-containing ribonuclease [Caldilineaceae bacterium]|nr:RNB domain-containing ribonuclease [Caldilineaceae bacterium]
MASSTLPADSFVLYKQRPARVVEPGSKKLTIHTEDGERLSVRPKDVLLLHPGPLHNMNELRKQGQGDIMAAWELLAGQTTTLQDVAELAFDEFTPAGAWTIWQMAADGLYFRAEAPEMVEVLDETSVAAIQTERAAKAAEAAAWQEFAERIRAGRHLPQDVVRLSDVEELALGAREGSHTLKALDLPETPQAAHRLLLKIGFWDENVNPYPARLGCSVEQPDFPLSDLPDEPRRELTHLAAFAIDDRGSSDPDDAISWDGERLWVHVADVAALLSPESQAETEARDRGANLYLPEGTVHMLPESMTQRLGLGLHEVSPALSFGIIIADDGSIADVEITPSWVQVTRLSYEEADGQIYDGPLQAMRGALERFSLRRRNNGAIELSFPEIKLSVNDGEIDIRPIERTASRELVREAMLLAGEAVAQYAQAHDIPIPYTVQDPPAVDDEDELKTDTLAEMYAMRRRLYPGRQVSEPGPHSGLGLECYAQVTSPLRRYHDMLVHQQLRAYLRGESLLDAETVMTRTAEARTQARHVRTAERLSISHWLMVYLRRHPDWQGEAIALEQRRTRTLLLLPELALETEIYGRNGIYPDDKAEVALTGVDLPELTATFRFV